MYGVTKNTGGPKAIITRDKFWKMSRTLLHRFLVCIKKISIVKCKKTSHSHNNYIYEKHFSAKICKSCSRDLVILCTTGTH